MTVARDAVGCRMRLRPRTNLGRHGKAPAL